MKAEIRVWEKLEGRDRTKSDINRFQCDIFCRGSDHHGIGETKSVAVFRAVQRWLEHEAMQQAASDQDQSAD